MSKQILEILKYYNELHTDDPESELVHIKADLDRALLEVRLDEEERALITILYLTDSTEIPIRGKPDKNGGQSGRPSGGTTQVQAARSIITEDRTDKAKELKAGRILKRASAKLAAFLGEGYE